MTSLYRPIKTNLLGQAFGANIPVVKLDSNGKPIRPFIVQTFPKSDGQGGVIWDTPVGWTKFYLAIGLLGHNAEDWVTWHGEPVYFNACQYGFGNVPLEGTVKNEIDPDGGKGVDVLFKDPVSQREYKLRYWHLKDSAVYDGQVVKSGDLLGYCDSTGASVGDHLHWSLKPQKNGVNEFQTNGFTGAVNIRNFDGIKYYPDDFILNILNLTQQLSLLQQIVKLLSLLKGRKQ